MHPVCLSLASYHFYPAAHHRSIWVSFAAINSNDDFSVDFLEFLALFPLWCQHSAQGSVGFFGDGGVRTGKGCLHCELQLPLPLTL